MAKSKKVARFHADVARWMKTTFKTIQQAATKYKISTDTVRKICLEHDVPFSAEMTAQRDDAILALTDEGKTKAEIAETFEISIRQVERAVSRANRGYGAGGKYSERVFILLADLLHTDFTQAEIGARHGVSRQTVYNTLKTARKHGIMFPGRDKE